MEFHVCHFRLNNRKARLARTAKDVRAAVGDADNPVPDKQRGPVPGSYDSPDSPGDASHARKDNNKPEPSLARFVDIGSPVSGHRGNTGQYVVLVNGRGAEVGKGKVFQVRGMWHGNSLDGSATCVVDVTELKADKGSQLPYPSPATGNSFAEAETKFGVMRVLWDSNRVFELRSE